MTPLTLVARSLVPVLLALLSPVLATDSTIIVVRPYSKSATLVPGQPLNFECGRIYDKGVQFLWYKRNAASKPDDPFAENLLDPNLDDTIEIHNERLTLLKPTYSAVGDYICRALHENRTVDENEFATIKVRAPPYISDFGVETSHTGKSVSVAEGERLELSCQVRDRSVPVNVTWLMSESPQDTGQMQPVTPEREPSVAAAAEAAAATPAPPLGPGDVPSYPAPANVYVERVDAFTKKLVIRETGHRHRGHYACLVDNGVTEKAQKFIYVRVKDRIVALWPFLGILAQLFILFTIIYVWETQRAQKALTAAPSASKAAAGSSLSPRDRLLPPRGEL